jgi:hypothetical protein
LWPELNKDLLRGKNCSAPKVAASQLPQKKPQEKQTVDANSRAPSRTPDKPTEPRHSSLEALRQANHA